MPLVNRARKSATCFHFLFVKWPNQVEPTVAQAYQKQKKKKEERKSGVSPETTQAQSMYYMHVNDSKPLDYQDLQTDK